MVQQINRDYVESVPGFRVVAMARNSKEAIAAVRQHRPDLVLLDVYMPDQDGVATLKELRRHELAADVMMVSAAQDAQTIKDVVRYGAVDYIIKPFRLERLRAALEAYRDKRRNLAATDMLDQAQVDRVLRGYAGHPDAGLPKGLNEATLREVQEYLIQHGKAFSAAQVADHLGTARVTARRYLDYLVTAGKARLEVQHGAVGRPVNLYRAMD